MHDTLAAALMSLTLSAPYSDHMVVQQGQKLHLRGHAAAGSEVAARFEASRATAKADAQGQWALDLTPPKAGGPYALTLSAGSDQLQLNDILVGEVWLASGQSNMEWAMASATGPSPAVLKESHPQIRLLSVPRKVGTGGDAYAGLGWHLATPESQAPFSAVAFHFALALQKKLGVPVGIIAAPWSGTCGEAWAPLKDIEAAPELKPVLERWAKRSEPERQMYEKGWSFDLRFRDLKAVMADGSSHAITARSWQVASAEGAKTEAVEGHYQGLLPPGAWAAASGMLTDSGATVDWSDVIAVTFQAKGNSTFDLALSQSDITDGDQPCSAAFVTTDAWTDQRIELKSLKQQGWGQPKPFRLASLSSLKFRVHAPNQFPDQPGLLFEAMIKPLAGVGIRGALWYQGESNAERAAEYVYLLKAIVQGWRKALGADLAFLVVQLPEYQQAAGSAHDPWAEIRAAQATVLELPNTGLIETIGLGDLKDVHPRLKAPVGERLAKKALGLVYGM